MRELRSYRFGPYVVDPRKRLLWRNRVLVPLTSKAFEILLVLVENRDHVVGKPELLEAVWQNTAVEDNTLTRHISTLRKALDERPDHHQYILTVPGRGYQFVADVDEADGSEDELQSGSRVIEDVTGHRLAGHFATAHALAPQPAGGPLSAMTPALPVFVGVSVPQGRRRQPAATIILAAGLAIFTGTLVVATIRLRPPTHPQAHRTLRQFTFQSGLQRDPTWSPDGRTMAFVSDRSGNSDVWIQGLDHTEPVQVTTTPAEESDPDWSPDGDWLAFRSEGERGGLYVVSPQGGAMRRVANFGYRPRWSPDGRMLLFSSSGHQGGIPRFHLVGLDGDPPRALRPDVFSDLKPLHVEWTPKGAVSIWGQDAQDRWTFLTVPVEQGAPVRSALSPDVDSRIRTAAISFERFVWSRSGRFLFFEGTAHESRSIWRITIDPSTLAWVDGPERLTSGTTEDVDLAVSPDATRLAFAAISTRTRLWAFPFDAVAGRVLGDAAPVTSGGAGEQDADTPDDGSTLVYRAVRAGQQEIWQRSLVDGRERLLIPADEWTRTRPRWSPDGKRLAYQRRRAGGASSDGAVVEFSVESGVERQLTRPGEPTMVPGDWSADGRWLVGSCPQGTARRPATCLLDVSQRDGAEAGIKLLQADAAHNRFEHRFSPNQRWISFVAVNAADAGVSTIFVLPVQGGVPRAITDGREYDDKPHWSPDGRTIYFVSHREGVLNVWGQRFDHATGTTIGRPFRVTSFTGPRQMISTHLSRMQIAVTSSRLFLPITEQQSELWLLNNVDR